MQTKNRNIVIVLLLVILLPVAYQFAHSFTFHHHHHYPENVSQHLSHSEFSNPVTDESCPLCEYEYTVFDDVRQMSYSKQNMYVSEVKLTVIRLFIPAQNLSNISLRGPPVIS